MLRVRTSLTGVAGAPYLSTIFFDASLADAQLAAAAAREFWVAAAPCISSAVAIQVQSQVEQIDPVSGEITGSASTTTTPAAGTGGASYAPLSNQGLIRLRTGVYVGGREVRGKIFLPAVDFAKVTGQGKPASTYLTAANAAIVSLLGAPGPFPVVWSRKNGVALPVTAGSVWSEFAVLRSRRD